MPLDGEKKKERPEPASPLQLPTDNAKLISKTLDIIGECRVSAGIRASYCRMANEIIENGRMDGTRSLINLLFSTVDRLASHLFSPTSLRFMIDYENDYPPEYMKRAQRASRILTRQWEHASTDMTFGQGVFEALKYGATILKQWPQQDGNERLPVYYHKLIMPWQFGVMVESEDDLSRQPAMCETFLLTMPEVWRRIAHLPDARALYDQIEKQAQKGFGSEDSSSFFHQVMSTSQLNTSATGSMRPVAGGIVSLNNAPNYAIMGPEVAVPRVKMHEIWVWGQKDYNTIQLIEPNILVTRYKIGNALVHGDTPSGLQPYTMIQANPIKNYIWGRSEIADLIEPQQFLSETANDIKRLFGVQVDKILGFSGYDGITVEKYDQMRAAGYFDMPPGATVNDLTPKFPAEALTLLDKIITIIERISGFNNILSGSGESGVRAGVHAETLLKTSSPRLRDRALLVERQCARAADLTLSLAQIKDGRGYWTNGESEESREKTKFILSDIPEDRRVSVDSHSSSPIFADSHENLIGFGLKGGFLDGEDAINELPYPNKDLLLQRFHARQAQQQKMMEDLKKTNPEAYIKLLTHSKGHH